MSKPTHPLADKISQFSDECNEEEYTDTGDAWELLNRCQEELNSMQKKIAVLEHQELKMQHGCWDAWCPECDPK